MDWQMYLAIGACGVACVLVVLVLGLLRMVRQAMDGIGFWADFD